MDEKVSQFILKKLKMYSDKSGMHKFDLIFSSPRKLC